MIDEPKPFSPRWFSHKLNHAGLRYEIALSIKQSSICWVRGPFPCGEMNDMSIYSSGLRDLLMSGEEVVADDGYHDSSICSNTTLTRSVTRRIRARHETVNHRLKAFKIIGGRFRHNKVQHGTCFHAVAQVVQISFRVENALFSV